MNKAIFTLMFLLLASFSLPVMGQGGKSVDLSTSEVWPALKGDIPNASISDGTYTYYGGHKYIPKHFFDGFSTIGLPVNHPGAESITFDWQLQLTQDPNGAATVVFDQTNEFTLSTGESDVITFGEPINYTQPGNYLLEADITSASDPNTANNHAEFAYAITEEVYGFADKNNMTGSYNVFANAMAAVGDGLGIVLDVPASAGNPIVLNSASVYIKNELPEVIENGNAQLIAVLWTKDASTGEWDFASGSLVQSLPVTLGSEHLDSEVTLTFDGGYQINNAGEYLLMVHLFNNGDPANDGAIVIGTDPNGQAPSDLSRILMMSGSVNYITETPGIWANFAPGEGAVSNAAEILTYALPGQTDATINAGAGTITVQMPQGADLTNLAADFTLSAGATAEVGTTTQESGVTTNDFSSPVVYTVTAEDGTTTKDWTVTASVAASAAAEILTYSLPGQTDATINAAVGTITVQMPQGADLTNLAADFTLSAGATAEVGTTTQESGVTTNDFSSPVVYTVTAEDGTTTKDWTVTASVAASAAAEILTYSLPGQTDATINAAVGTITVQMPQGADLTNLAADFTLSAGATAEVGTTTQESGVTTNDFSSPVVYTVTAEDGTTTKDWTVTASVAASAAAEILTYSLPGQTDATINAGAGTITVQMPQGADLTNLAADFTLSAGATAEVGTTTQESGVTTNDFSSPVVYTVTAEDGTTTKDWTVTVIVEASSDAEVLAFEIIGQVQSSISNSSSNISVLMPQGADITNLIAEFSLSAGASATISSVPQESGVTANDFTNPVTYTVTAADGVTTRNWTVLVNTMNTSPTAIVDYSVPNQITDAIFNGNEITIYMAQTTDVTALVPDFVLAAGASATVNGVPQESGVTANDFTNPITYTVTAYDGVTTEDWTVIVEIYTPSEGDFVEYELENQYNSVINPGNRTISVEVFDNADITNLVATFSVAPGAVVKVGGVIQESGVTANDFTEDVNYQIDGPSGNVYTWTVMVTQLPSDASELLSFSIPNQVDGFINNSQNTVEVIMPPGIDISQLIPEFSVSIGATVTVDGVEQQSGETVNDFTQPLTYTITAADGVTTAQWLVTVFEQSTDAFILTYSIPNQVSSSIDEDTKEINVTMPAGSDVSALIAEFTLSQGAVAHIDGVEQESGVTENNFANPVTYTVTAADGVTTAAWLVTVDVEIPEVGILSYSIPGELSNTLDDSQQQIYILMPAGTDITSLVAEFTLTDGATATVNGVEQTSGETENDFTNPITYTITAADGVTTEEWLVTVDVEIPEVGILSYSIPGELSNTLDDSQQQIDILMPAGTDITSLVAEFTLTDGATATVNGVEQTSGETANDFTNEVVYTITASDGVTSEDWSVYVTTAAAEADFITFTIPGQVNSIINSAAASIEVIMPNGSDLSMLTPQFTLSDGANAVVDGEEQVSGETVNDFTQPVEYLVIAIDDTEKIWTVTVTEEQSSPTDFLSYTINGVEGQIDEANAYIRVELPAGSDLTSLVATYQVVDGTNVRIGSAVQESGVTTNDFSEIVKYRLIPESGSSRYWRVKVVVEGDMNDGANILYYGFYGQTNPAEINETTRTISVNLDPQLNVSQLMPMFYLSEGAIAYVNDELQWSGQNVMDFNDDVVYTILAEDGQTQSEWTVVVTTDQNASTNILAFSVAGVPSDDQYTTIYATTRTVYVDVPAGTPRDNMVAQFQLSSGATASIDGTQQESGVTVNNFVRPVIYSITAENGTNVNDWTVAVRHYIGTYEFAEPQLTVYPNPVRDLLNIAVPAEYLQASISVVSMKGEVLMNVNSDGLTNQIDVSSISGGLYLIIVQTPHKRLVEKVMIE